MVVSFFKNYFLHRKRKTCTLREPQKQRAYTRNLTRPVDTQHNRTSSTSQKKSVLYAAYEYLPVFHPRHNHCPTLAVDDACRPLRRPFSTGFAFWPLRVTPPSPPRTPRSFPALHAWKCRSTMKPSATRRQESRATAQWGARTYFFFLTLVAVRLLAMCRWGDGALTCPKWATLDAVRRGTRLW